MLSHAKPEESDPSLKVSYKGIMYSTTLDQWMFGMQRFIIHNSSSSLGNARLISHAHSSYWEIYNMKLSIDSYVVCIRSDLHM